MSQLDYLAGTVEVLSTENEKLRARIVELEEGVRTINGASHALCNKKDARIAELEAENKTLREALKLLSDATNNWCEAVNRDSSWDGLAHHYKNVRWKVFPAARAALSGDK